MRLLRVATDTKHLSAAICEHRVMIAKAAGFLGAAGRVILRVEVHDHVLASGEVRQTHLFPLLVFERKDRSLITSHETGRATDNRIEQSHIPPRVVKTSLQHSPENPR